MLEGPSTDRHHWKPKLKGGSEIGRIHKICHRMIHKVFSETELAQKYSTPEALRENPEIAEFVKWVRQQPADYLDWPKAPRTRKNKRRGNR